MYIKKITYLLILTILVACSERNPNSPYINDDGENTNTATSKARYFPDNIGSFWVYETFELDSMNQVMKQSLSYDSVIVESGIVKANRKSKLFTNYRKTTGNYQKNGENYYAFDGKKLLTLQIYLNKFFQGIPFSFINFSANDWITIVNPDDDLWRVYRMKLDNTTIPNLPFGTMNGKVDVLASWEGKKNINIDGRSLSADEYLITFEFDGDIAVPFINTIHISVTRELYQYYANDIGLVYESMSSSALSIPLLGNINLPGYQSKLIRYNIN